ncbi:hypothetical protein Athai_66350 [Actinocatenispora thailandica]|uniref:Uncharacterized protein n=1 Tax=Actinocatenispora thailandica TaxID=227318 RepID=A0A7R7DWE7_9ACTN|nr:hypothetical protein [Actinocatenispora thailandica]BCJ39132.1 hypothetical protein Athai_66350 [Actinocatenispora thailandica]
MREDELPPEGGIVELTAAARPGRTAKFRAIGVRRGEQPGTAVLHGWYLDGSDIREQDVPVRLAGVRVVSES